MTLYLCGHDEFENSRETKSKEHKERKGSERVNIFNVFAKKNIINRLEIVGRLPNWPMINNTILFRQRKYLQNKQSIRVERQTRSAKLWKNWGEKKKKLSLSFSYNAQHVHMIYGEKGLSNVHLSQEFAARAIDKSEK